MVCSGSAAYRTAAPPEIIPALRAVAQLLRLLLNFAQFTDRMALNELHASYLQIHATIHRGTPTWGSITS
jgi:hypothetical protein